jgi:hypothetical protein
MSGEHEASDEALDLLEAIVREQWVYAGGCYRLPNASSAAAIARLLVARRPQRWEATPDGLTWHAAAGFTYPQKRRGEVE